MTDELFYGGGERKMIVSPDGVDFMHVAPDVLLSNEFELVVASPGELSDDQEAPAFLLTFKGRPNQEKNLASRTIVFTPEMALQLFKALNSKWRELPIESR